MSLRSVAVALLFALVLLASIGVAASHGDKGGWRADDDGGLGSSSDVEADKGAGGNLDEGAGADEGAGGFDRDEGVMSALGRSGGHGVGRSRGGGQAYGLRRGRSQGHKRARVVRRLRPTRSRGNGRRVSRGRRAAARRAAPRRVSRRRVKRRLRARGVRRGNGNANGRRRRAARQRPVGARDTSQPRPSTSTPDRPVGGSTSPPSGGSPDPGATPGGSGGGAPSPGAGPGGGAPGGPGAPGAGNPLTLTPLFTGIGLRPASGGGLIFTAPELRALPGGDPADDGRAGEGSDGAGGSSDGDPGDSSRRGRDGDGDGDGDGAWDPLFGAAGEPLTSVADAVPENLQWLITALAALATLALGSGVFVARRAGAAARRRRALLDDIGLLQSALLPPVPERVGGLRASVAYRPWDGPGAGGDFYDVFPLADGRAGVVLGDVAGHGRDVIGRTSALRHTLRAYLDAGLEPRAALELAGRVLERGPGGPLATAVLGVHDPERGSLTWASAGHPLPILVGAERAPAPNGVSAPPLGAGVPTGIRQTTVPFPAGTAVCLYTDGLADARVGDRRLDRDRVTEIATELGSSLTAPAILDRVSAEATEITDDMTVCVLRPAASTPPIPSERQAGRVEELALPAAEVSTSTMQRFLGSCGVEAGEALETMGSAREAIRSGAGGVLMRVHLDRPEPVEVSSLDRAALSPTA